jgi:hypothetical protein
MPLQNRVDPFGELFADPACGTFMGNRGGRFHTGGKRSRRGAGLRGNGSAARLRSKDDIVTYGGGSTPSCFFSMSRPRSPPGTGPALNAGEGCGKFYRALA